MDALTPSDLLQSLPGLLYIWSLFVLGWGLIAGLAIYKMSQRLSQCGDSTTCENDQHALWFITAVNIFLTWYLFEYHNVSECASWIVVVNVFYTAHLLYVSLGAAKLWKVVNQRCVTRRLIG